MTESFIELHSNAVNERMVKFQDEVRQKLEALKNKKVKSSEIDKYYIEVQDKMKSLQKIVDSAFKELKAKSEPEDHAKSKIKTSRMDTADASESKMSSNNSSRLSDSEATIKSINLGTSSKISKSQQKEMQEKILDFNESSSIDSVNSIFLESNKNIAKEMASSLKASTLNNSSKVNVSMKKQEQPG